MSRINSMIENFGAVLIEVFSQYDPDRLLDSLTTSDRNQAENFVLYYSNDYVYIRAPKN